MKEKILFFACLSFLTALCVSAQTKTVTNSDLTKFRNQRLAAERDLRENYVKLGFPSPEELERQREKDAVERETLSARLTAERYERERLAAEQERLEYEADYFRSAETPVYSGYSTGYNGVIFSGGYFSRYSSHRNRNWEGRRLHFNRPFERRYPTFRTSQKRGAVFLKR
ncbi:MAG: hypothetical protein H7070_01590 [Saprospiraceae bacterium]|nr:hypothetical protein [Pyrinomonadaceae bacterium]